MSPAETLTPVARYHLREFHSFEAAGASFVYLVPSGAIFALDEIGSDTIERIGDANPTVEELASFQSILLSQVEQIHSPLPAISS